MGEGGREREREGERDRESVGLPYMFCMMVTGLFYDPHYSRKRDKGAV